ncbi:MAG: proline iminopeptidase [Gaiellales bacterium]|jgi:proline iminopeptidase|nr:proline iminopeptidase [Gaiellales bacterium]
MPIQRVVVAVLVLTLLPAACGGSGAKPVANSTRSAAKPARRALYITTTSGTTRSPVLVLVNGGPGLGHAYLRPLAASLASPSLRVAMYDQRGVGRSPAPPNDDYSLIAYVRDLESVRRSLGVARMALLGHSWGGLVAAGYAAHYPHRVSALVLVDAQPVNQHVSAAGDTHFAAHVQHLQRVGLLPRQLPSNRGDDCSRSFAAIIPAYLARPARHIPNSLRTWTCSVHAGQRTSAQLRGTADLLVSLTHYTGPALVIVGADDPFGAAWPRAIVRELPRARTQLRTISAAGHFPWAESPRFAVIVRRYLQHGVR